MTIAGPSFPWIPPSPAPPPWIPAVAGMPIVGCAAAGPSLREREPIAGPPPWIPAVAGMTIVGCAAAGPSFPWRREPIAGPPPWIPAVAGMTIVGCAAAGPSFPWRREPIAGPPPWIPGCGNDDRGVRRRRPVVPVVTGTHRRRPRRGFPWSRGNDDCGCARRRPVVPVETGTHRRPPAVDWGFPARNASHLRHAVSPQRELRKGLRKRASKGLEVRSSNQL